MSDAIKVYDPRLVNAEIDRLLSDKTVTREVLYDRLCTYEKNLQSNQRITFNVVCMLRVCGLTLPPPPAEIITPIEAKQ